MTALGVSPVPKQMKQLGQDAELTCTLSASRSGLTGLSSNVLIKLQSQDIYQRQLDARHRTSGINEQQLGI